jgi:hypothetical protein
MARWHQVCRFRALKLGMKDYSMVGVEKSSDRQEGFVLACRVSLLLAITLQVGTHVVSDHTVASMSLYRSTTR